MVCPQYFGYTANLCTQLSLLLSTASFVKLADRLLCDQNTRTQSSLTLISPLNHGCVRALFRVTG